MKRMLPSLLNLLKPDSGVKGTEEGSKKNKKNSLCIINNIHTHMQSPSILLRMDSWCHSVFLTSKASRVKLKY